MGKMSQNILSEHFLSHFLYSQEPFAVIGGRLYTLSKTNGRSGDKHEFHFLGKTYALDESEEVSQLEKGMFIARSSQIEEMMSQYIHLKFLSKITKTKAQLQHIKNVYASAQDDSIERFIMIDVFNEYNHERREGQSKKEVKVSNWDNIPEINRRPEVYELISDSNSLESLIGSLGFIVINRKCYNLDKNRGHRDENKGYVIFGNYTLDLMLWMPLEELCKRYTENLACRINQKADEHGKEFVKIIEQINREKTQLSDAINSRASTRTSDKRGEIGFNKIGEGDYEITVTIPPYIIEKNGEYFAFGAIILGTKIRARNNRVMISDKPKVMNMPYIHPFVWPNSSICFGDLNWTKQRDVRFNHWYDLSDKKALAKRIAIVMRAGKTNIERGYVGSTLTPVRDIHNCDCYIGNRRKEAEGYAKANGIPNERIIKND
jgi:hypothetical protein